MLVHMSLLKGVLIDLFFLVVNFVKSGVLCEAFDSQGTVGSVEVPFKVGGRLGDINHVNHDLVTIPFRRRSVR